jgi:curved DNA-binding protein CbpA
MRLGKDVLEADLYADLGVLPDATASELRVAYRTKARQSHPDLNRLDPEAASRMSRLNVAARVLLDPTLRSAYDRQRRSPQRTRWSATPSRGRRGAWFERRAQSHDGEWSEPTLRADPAGSVGFAHFSRSVRSREGQLSLRLDELIHSLSSRQQLAVAALLVAVAACLVAMARPHSLGGGLPGAHQPTTISAGVLFP